MNIESEKIEVQAKPYYIAFLNVYKNQYELYFRIIEGKYIDGISFYDNHHVLQYATFDNVFETEEEALNAIKELNKALLEADAEHRWKTMF